MTNYEFQYEKCMKCKKNSYCILDLDLNMFLCQDCYGWSLGYADKKDKINLLFAKIPDIEK